MRSLNRLILNCRGDKILKNCRGFVFLFVCALLIWWACISLTRQSTRLRDSACADFIPKAPEVDFVLIKGYMRGGTTFLSDILQQHVDAVYFHEPVFLLQWYNTTLNSQEIEHLFNCDLHLVDQQVLFSVARDGRISRKTQNFVQCLDQTQKDTQALNWCRPLLTSACDQSTLRIIKELRMYMHDTEHLFRKYPNFKLIHLVRDPRAIIFSRLKVKSETYSFKKKGMEERELCSLMEGDLDDSKYLLTKYPNRMKYVQYESLARDVINQTHELFKFINRTPTTEVLEYIKSITSQPDVEEDQYLTRRSNSSSVVDRWRITANFESVRLIDSICENVYKRLGYRTADSDAMLKDTRIPLTLPPIS